MVTGVSAGRAPGGTLIVTPLWVAVPPDVPMICAPPVPPVPVVGPLPPTPLAPPAPPAPGLLASSDDAQASINSAIAQQPVHVRTNRRFISWLPSKQVSPLRRSATFGRNTAADGLSSNEIRSESSVGAIALPASIADTRSGSGLHHSVGRSFNKRIPAAAHL